MKNLKVFILIAYLFFSPLYAYTYEASVEYNDVYVDYKSLNYNEWKLKAKNYLEKARESKQPKEQTYYYSMAAGAYQTLIKISPKDAEVMATLGHIYGKMNRSIQAKAFLDRGLNLDIKNPLVNYYYGIFREDEKDFRKALKFYNAAFKYGMSNDGNLNLRLAVVNAKLGELEKAQFHYQRACQILNNKALNTKIHQLDELKK